MTAMNLALISLLPALVIIAALKDLTSMTIPNWISGVLILGFGPAAWAAGLDMAAVGGHLAAGALALAVGIGLFAGRIIGGGDAKLMAAAALWLGWGSAGMAALWIGLFGGAFCLLLILARQGFQPYVSGIGGWAARLLEPKGDIPYGVAICAGVLMVFPACPIAVALAIGG